MKAGGRLTVERIVNLGWVSWSDRTFTLRPDWEIMEDAFIMTDPVNWEGEWINTKVWYRYDNSDIEEAYCLPDLNE